MKNHWLGRKYPVVKFHEDGYVINLEEIMDGSRKAKVAWVLKEDSFYLLDETETRYWGKVKVEIAPWANERLRIVPIVGESHEIVTRHGWSKWEIKKAPLPS